MTELPSENLPAPKGGFLFLHRDADGSEQPIWYCLTEPEAKSFEAGMNYGREHPEPGFHGQRHQPG
jgi:hypothetical protein